jgi:hypothetical protein
MLEKLVYANLGYESYSFGIILNEGNEIKKLELNKENLLKKINLSKEELEILEIIDSLISEKKILIRNEKENIIKKSVLSKTEVDKFFNENEILSVSSNENGLNAVIFRNKETNEIEISVGGTEDYKDYLNNAALLSTGYPIFQGIDLTNLIMNAELNNLILPTDKINFYGHSLAKSIIETTLITYYANNTSKLEQINELNYFNGVSISRNNNIFINLDGLQDQNISIIQDFYNKENIVNDIIVNTGFDVVPNSVLTGLFSRTLITEDIRIGVGFNEEKPKLDYTNHFLSVAYKILKVDDFVFENNLSEEDKQNLYNIYNINFKNKETLGTEIENFEKFLTSYADKNHIIKTLDALTNLGKTDLINQIINNPEDIDNILNNLSEKEKKEIDLAIFVKENTIYNSAVKLTVNSHFFDIFNKDEESNFKIKEAVQGINNYINKNPYTFSQFIEDIDQNIIKPIRDFSAEHKLYDPLVLDLNHDGIINTSELNDSSTAFYDLDKDGYKEQTGWLNKEDGFLINGTNNTLFGVNGSSGYEELKSFDSNSDNLINVNDTNFKDLKVWQDYNQNGIVEENELTSLEELKITEINLINTITHEDNNGNTILATSTFTQDNNTYLSANINFQINDTLTKFEHNYDLSVQQFNLKGFGKVKDLNISTYEDPTLKLWIENNLNTQENLFSNFDLFIKKWANINSPTKDSTEITLAEKAWLIETFADKNGLKSYIESVSFSESSINRRTSLTDKYEILKEYENLKLNYLTQFYMKNIKPENYLGLSINENNNKIYISNIYTFYSDLSNIINTENNNETIFYLHLLKENDLLKYVNQELISPLLKTTYLLDLFKNNDFDHIVSTLNRTTLNNDIILNTNNAYNNQFVYLENNNINVNGQNNTTYLTKDTNNITTKGYTNNFILKDGTNIVNASEGDLVNISSYNSLNTLNLSKLNNIFVNLTNSISTINSSKNINEEINTDKSLVYIKSDISAISKSVKISTSNENDNISIKLTDSANLNDLGGDNIFNLSFIKDLNLISKGNNNISLTNNNLNNLSLSDGFSTISGKKAYDINLNLQNSKSNITLAEGVNHNISSDSEMKIYSKNVYAANLFNINSSSKNDDVYLRNVNEVNIVDNGGTNKINTSFINNLNINSYNSINDEFIIERVKSAEINLNNSTNSKLSIYGVENFNLNSDKGITLSSNSYQKEKDININTSNEKDILNLIRHNNINIIDKGGNNIININEATNSNIKTGSGNDTISYKSIGNNIIDSGEGDDIINSYAGEDTFIINKNNGNDIINNNGGLNDILKLFDFVKEKIIFYFKGSDLVIGTEDNNSVTIKNQLIENNKIEEISLSNEEGNFKLDMNKLIQDMNAFTSENGAISINEVDIRKNQNLMTIYNNSWTQN